jgi:small subunit ribosomal protein S11
MSEDKNKNKKNNEEVKATEKEADVKAGKEDRKATKEVEKEKVEKGIGDLEELPEDIIKRMEKRKTEVKKLKSKKKVIKKRKKIKTNVSVGKAYVKSSYNNTLVTLTDMQGNVLSWASAGIAGFKGPKKATPYAAQIITRIAVGKAREEYGLKEVSVFVRGVGTGRESAIRALNNNGLIVTSIKDITPIPHNGCRPKKPRRV